MKKIRFYLANRSNLGKLIIIVGLLMAIPIMVVPFYPHEVYYIPYFLIPSVLSIIVGGLLIVFVKKTEIESNLQNLMAYSHMIVLSGWFYGFIMGAMPFYLSGMLTFPQALFESVSGWTTTGLSVVDVTQIPQIYLFHRSFMQFCGGMGFVMVMIMFVQGKYAMSLFNAEGHPDKLMPNLNRTARTVLIMFLILLVIGTGLYVIFGMPVFDGIIHAMSALSTGGFSNKVDSIGAYGSIEIEAVTIILMLIGTMNFAVLLYFMKGNLLQVIKVSEVKLLSFLTLVFTSLVGFSIFFEVYHKLGYSLRVALFNVVSAISTTGYSTVTYTDWPDHAIGLLIILMIIGGGIGSTAGGLKLSRVVIMQKVAFENFVKRISPSRKVKTLFYVKAQGKVAIDQELVEDTFSFFYVYLAIFVIGSILISVSSGFGLLDAMFDFSSALGTVGLSIGVISSVSTPFTLYILIIGMILGRLEIFIVLVGIHSGIKLILKTINNRFVRN